MMIKQSDLINERARKVLTARASKGNERRCVLNRKKLLLAKISWCPRKALPCGGMGEKLFPGRK
jgi:hypothetical protein